MIGENIKGYRRTAFKSRHQNLVDEKLRYFKDRGFKTKVAEVGQYKIIYIKDDKDKNERIKNN